MLAFSDDSNSKQPLTYIDTAMNIFFFIDILLNFVSAYYTVDYDIVDD